MKYRTLIKNTKAFVIEVDTRKVSALNTTFTLPFPNTGFTYRCRVNWGDGTFSTILQGGEASLTHTYPSPGVYEISVKGRFDQIRFDNGGDKLLITKIKQWGSNVWRNFALSFYGCANLDITATDIPDLTLIPSFSNTFNGCSSLTNGNFVGWNTSGVTNMTACFAGCTNFNKDLSSWDMSNVTAFASTFAGATSFNNGGQPLTWSSFVATNYSFMFLNATSFNQNVSSFIVSNATNLQGMFQGATVYNNGGQPLLWTINTNPSANVSMVGLFRQTSFTQDISGWNTSRVTNMATMFQQTPFNIDISSWNTSNVTNMFRMFYICSNFNQPIGTWNTSNVTDMGQMFQQSAFNSDISGWNTSNVSNMYRMFFNNNVFNQPIGIWNTSNVTDMGEMFSSSIAFNQNIGSWNISNVTNFIGFMSGKSFANFSTANLDAIYNGWSSQIVQPNISIGFGSIKYTAAGSAGKAILTGTYGWSITDGGI